MTANSEERIYLEAAWSNFVEKSTLVLLLFKLDKRMRKGISLSLNTYEGEGNVYWVARDSINYTIELPNSFVNDGTYNVSSSNISETTISIRRSDLYIGGR